MGARAYTRSTHLKTKALIVITSQAPQGNLTRFVSEE